MTSIPSYEEEQEGGEPYQIDDLKEDDLEFEDSKTEMREEEL